MQRIDTATRAVDLFGPGKHGFKAGNPLTGDRATALNADWFNAVQEELVGFVEAGGLDLDAGDRGQVLKAFVQHLAEPLAALPYPTVATADYRIGAVGAVSAGTGGTVSVPADVRLQLGQEVDAGVTGRRRSLVTSAWVSDALAANATYYLRAHIDGGALAVYVQQGTDADAIPVGLKGTPGAAAGGGFDSTPLDILLAKVVTGAAGTAPTVTNLANAAILAATQSATPTPVATGGSGAAIATSAMTLNWARGPRMTPFSAVVVSGGGSTLEGYANQFQTPTVSRYSVSVTVITDWSGTSLPATLSSNFYLAALA